jgi:hypothetical protein
MAKQTERPIGKTHRDVDPCGGGGSADTDQTMKLHSLRVLGKRTLKWLRYHLKQPDERPQSASHPLDSGAKKRKSDAPLTRLQIHIPLLHPCLLDSHMWQLLSGSPDTRKIL